VHPHQGRQLGRVDEELLVEFRQHVAGAQARRGGDRVLVVSNQIGPNAAKQSRAEIALPTGLSDVCILDNTFAGDRNPAVSVAEGAGRIWFFGNKVAGRDAGPGDLRGAAALVRLQRPERSPPVGPAALPLDGARHLHISELPPWDERWA
jgi:hypothetical protein